MRIERSHGPRQPGDDRCSGRTALKPAAAWARDTLPIAFRGRPGLGRVSLREARPVASRRRVPHRNLQTGTNGPSPGRAGFVRT
jgi:hypothetical protein